MAISSTSWRPGQSGNVGGRAPRGETYAEIIRRQLAEPYTVRPPKRPTRVPEGERLTLKEHIVQVMIRQACAGNLPALQWLADRDEGRTTERVALEGGLSIVPWAEKTDAETAAEAGTVPLDVWADALPDPAR